MKNKNETFYANTSDVATATAIKSIRYGEYTVGETINNLAEAFSAEADFHGLFILEQALEKAKEMRSQQQRLDEADAIFAKVGKWTDGGETEDDERSNGPTIN